MNSNSLIADLLRDIVRSAWTLNYSRLQSRLLLLVFGAATALSPRLRAQVPDAESSSPASISGRVVNAVTGLPVARALVRLRDRAVLTSYDGKFEFDQVTDTGGNILQVVKPGFYANLEPNASSNIYMRTSEIKAPLELRLYPEALFTGAVTAPDGSPLPHVLVSARRSVFNGSGHVWIPVAQVQTDSHGRFRLPVPSGDYQLTSMYLPRVDETEQAVLPVVVPGKGSSTTSDVIHIKSGEEEHFDLHPATSRSYAVSATFDSDLGRGFPRVTARSSNGVTIALPVHFSRNEDTGAARMELPSGTYTLNASVRSPDGIEEGETTITVTNHDIAGVVFHLAPVPTLPVELQLDSAATSDNQQPPNALQFGLTLEDDQQDADTFKSPASLSVRRGGDIMFTVPPGSYRLRARNDAGAWYIKSASYGASDLLQQEMVVVPGAGGTPIRITVSDQTGSLQGNCKLGGVPADCWVYLIPTTPSASSVFITRGNAQGVYNYAHLPPGSYQAIAFEQMHSADYGDPAMLVPFATYVRAVTVNAGEKPTLDLDTISEAEMSR